MDQAARVSDFYMPMLARLSDDDKLDIISIDSAPQNVPMQ